MEDFSLSRLRGMSCMLPECSASCFAFPLSCSHRNSIQACIRAAKGRGLPIRFKVAPWPLSTTVPPPPPLKTPLTLSHSALSSQLSLHPAGGQEGRGEAHEGGRGEGKEVVGADGTALVTEERWEEVESHFMVTVHAYGDSAFKKYQSMMR